ncbi:cystathionine beta-synthase [Liquorilactobacillus sucicola DSM 21376 = JCM 15457]|nr:cystathionine beta-synthase [Liquorilactobacillus sucicola DSM 21376 = JCM 15457]
MIYKTVEELVGNTPLIQLKIAAPNNTHIFAKLEMFNPGGSIKDRLGKYMLRQAQDEGLVKKGTTIIEQLQAIRELDLHWLQVSWGLSQF